MKQDQLFNKKQLAEAKSRHVINDTHIRGRNIANTIIKEKKKKSTSPISASGGFP